MLLTLTALLFGLLQGARHAVEPDHLAAVSTIVAERATPRSGLLLGAAWGLGHTLTLLAAGAILFALRAQLPARVEDACELAVAVMLVALGTRAIVRAAREGRSGPTHVHSHGGHEHAHAAGAPHVHVRGWTLARRPLLIGLVHGLAGSGALTALVLAKMASLGAAIAFMLLFGIGSTLGMALLTGMLGWPVAHIARRRGGIALVLGVTGVVSLALGVAWGWPIALRLLAV
jgi:hypothetical protein